MGSTLTPETLASMPWVVKVECDPNDTCVFPDPQDTRAHGWLETWHVHITPRDGKVCVDQLIADLQAARERLPEGIRAVWTAV